MDSPGKKTRPFPLLVVGVVSPVGGQSADENAGRDVVVRFEDAWNAHDMNAFGSDYDR